MELLRAELDAAAAEAEQAAAAELAEAEQAAP